VNGLATAPASDRLTFLIEHLDLPAATGDADAYWEGFQIAHLNNPSLLAIDRKARQVGWSWTIAAEAVAQACLTQRHTAIFISINQDEAREKIRYARQILEALDRQVRPGIVIDNQTELELVNGSRLRSHPCRPARGKAKADVYLDEFAHYPKDREIYAAAVPVVTRGGRLRIGSSPLGARGLFWEIYGQRLRRYPGYRRASIPWWHIRALCRDPIRAAKQAPTMLTEERVRRFGTPRLIEIFDNLPLEDFQQEYECAWVDESVAWISWDEIKRNQLEAQAERLLFRQARTVESALQAIDEVAGLIQEHRIEDVLAGGMDIGRKKDLTELVFAGKTTTAQTPYRLGISLVNTEFEDQKAVAAKALEVLPVTRLLIDRNGLGMQLAEELHKRFGVRAEGVDFTNATKELWAVELKVRMQRGEVPLPLDRDLSYQIHSLRKRLSKTKHAVFDVEASERHHGDKFWALALAVWAAKGRLTPSKLVDFIDE